MTDEADIASATEELLRSDAIASRARNSICDSGRVSAYFCGACDEPIPEARREAIDGVQTCFACQVDLEKALTRRST